MNEWMKCDKHFPPSTYLCTYINYNCIFYLTEIYWIENQPPGVGPRPSMVVPYGIAFGADTIHPALFHGSTCFKLVTDFLDSFISNLFLIGWLQTFQPERVKPLADNWKNTISIRWKVWSVTCQWRETDLSVTARSENCYQFHFWEKLTRTEYICYMVCQEILFRMKRKHLL